MEFGLIGVAIAIPCLLLALADRKKIIAAKREEFVEETRNLLLTQESGRMTEGNDIKIQIQAHGLAAMKYYDKSTFRINTHRPNVGPAWYEFCIYQNEDHLYDDSGIEVSMSMEQLIALRNEINEVLEGKK